MSINQISLQAFKLFSATQSDPVPYVIGNIAGDCPDAEE